MTCTARPEAILYRPSGLTLCQPVTDATAQMALASPKPPAKAPPSCHPMLPQLALMARTSHHSTLFPQLSPAPTTIQPP